MQVNRRERVRRAALDVRNAAGEVASARRIKRQRDLGEDVARARLVRAVIYFARVLGDE